MKGGFVYILSSSYDGVLYIGVTNNLIRRTEEHKEGKIEGFSKKYFCKNLVYYEYYEDITLAIQREKQLKGKKREKKIALIEANNPDWKDLFEEVKSLLY